MACDISDEDCGECNIQYCPEEIEDLNFKHLELKENIEQLEKDLEYAQKELNDFVGDHKSILIQI